MIIVADGSKWTVRRLRRRARSSSLRRDKTTVVSSASSINNKEDRDQDEKDVDTTEGNAAPVEVNP